MAALKTNKIIPVMVVAFVLMAGMVFFKASKPNSARPVVVESGHWMRSAPTPRTTDADTPVDTIRAIRGEVTAARTNADETLEMNKALIVKLDEMKTSKIELEEEQQSRVEQELATQSLQNQRQFDLMMARMGEMVQKISEAPVQQQVVVRDASNEVGSRQSQAMEIPDGFGVNIEAGQFVSGEDLIEVFWIEPLDESINNRVGGRVVTKTADRVQDNTEKFTTTTENAKALLMKPLGTYRDLVNGVADEPGLISKGKELIDPNIKKMSNKGSKGKFVEISASWRGPSSKQVQRVYKPTSEPYFTIPDLSILSGAVATTSLVGRIYPDGNVVDPQYFKLIVGRDNFTANYHELPSEIEGMIFEGYGVGDFTTRCVSGRLVAATFIFEDGTTRSIYPGDPGTRPEDQKTMGYITDPYGNPCITGRLITDAAEYFATGSALAFAGAYADAIRESGQSVTETIDPATGVVGNRTVTVDGDIGQFARASGVSAGLNRGARWFDEMFAGSKSLIYAPSGKRVDIHLQQELRLDIENNARKIRYRKNENRQNYLD